MNAKFSEIQRNSAGFRGIQRKSAEFRGNPRKGVVLFCYIVSKIVIPYSPMWKNK